MNKFNKIKAQALKEWEKFEGYEQPRILVGAATCGRAAGAESTIKAIKDEVNKRGMNAQDQ